MIRIIITLLLLSGLNFSAVFAAENRAETLLVTPVIGFDRLGGDQSHRIVPLTGLRLGYNLTAHWGGEMAFDQVASEGTSSAGLDQADNHYYRVDALYHVTPRQALVPYLAAGLGLYARTAPSGAQGRLTNMFGYGVGLKYFLRDEIALRAELRHLVTAGGGNVTATLGVAFVIGGVQTSAPPQSWVYQRYFADDVPAPVAALSPISLSTKDVAAVSPLKRAEGVPDSVALGSTSSLVQAVPLAVEEHRVEKKRVKLEIYFDTAKATIKPRFEPELRDFARYLRENPKATVVIEGHTDHVGSRSYNLKLSQRRGQSVADFLVSKLGIARERLSVIGYAFDQPIASNLTSTGRAQNRRVIAVVLE